MQLGLINITKKSEAIDKENAEFLYLSKSLGGDPYGTKKLVVSEHTELFLSMDKTLKTPKNSIRIPSASF